uniref:Uncharacterized protein n=1 Tax=Arundo donax TaxID=35708 RepID=A0A0A8YD82_ARUDO
MRHMHCRVNSPLVEYFPIASNYRLRCPVTRYSCSSFAASYPCLIFAEASTLK